MASKAKKSEDKFTNKYTDALNNITDLTAGLKEVNEQQ